ncbi:hypothetical protein NQ318_008202 [Aromia moschata]|uniref:Serine protease K12H4.7 n=1 Tax=Aromia moschata TaxID=1265417 RepID=A0AAV8YKT5_9CUCU|nr:hypothetical protein NQ318_008202 [Aromia moschata]
MKRFFEAFLAAFLLGFVSDVHGLKFYRGHLVGYDIPIGDTSDVTRSTARISTEYYLQRLDHFNPTNKVHWSQKYFVNDAYMSDEKNVVFLYIGGESQASSYWMSNGAWIEFAETHGALLFMLEHRYFGESQPFSDWSTENLRYLSSEQALNDLATFISAMNDKYELPEDVKWIAFGGSYAGAMAAWLRQKYPHLVHGAVSSSGPLFAQLDFPEYLQVVIDDLALHSQECVDNLKEAITQLEDLIQNPNEDEDLNSLFSFCDDIAESANSTSDLANLFELIADNFAGVAQYHKTTNTLYNINLVCEILNDESKGNELHRLAEVNNFVEGITDDSSCFDYKYSNIIEKWSNATVIASGMMRQWMYQTCTEFGYYQTSSQEIPVFGSRFPLSFFTQMCVDIFGEKFNETFVGEKVQHTNIFYGGFDIETSNVVFVHGTIDPWHVLGLIETVNPQTPSILINGTSHCADLYSSSSSDSAELTAAREQIGELLASWISA